MNGYTTAMRRYAEFSGRSSRAEFWQFVLVIVAVSIVANLLDVLVFGMPGGESVGLLGGIVSLVHIVPGLAVSVRRLHDIDRTGWWVLLGLVPIVGFIVLVVFYATPGMRGGNRYGPPA